MPAGADDVLDYISKQQLANKTYGETKFSLFSFGFPVDRCQNHLLEIGDLTVYDAAQQFETFKLGM